MNMTGVVVISERLLYFVVKLISQTCNIMVEQSYNVALSNFCGRACHRRHINTVHDRPVDARSVTRASTDGLVAER